MTPEHADDYKPNNVGGRYALAKGWQHPKAYRISCNEFAHACSGSAQMTCSTCSWKVNTGHYY
jgi:hypothetical protein